jgi:hypothetical protein
LHFTSFQSSEAFVLSTLVWWFCSPGQYWSYIYHWARPRRNEWKNKIRLKNDIMDTLNFWSFLLRMLEDHYACVLKCTRLPCASSGVSNQVGS